MFDSFIEDVRKATVESMLFDSRYDFVRICNVQRADDVETCELCYGGKVIAEACIRTLEKPDTQFFEDFAHSDASNFDVIDIVGDKLYYMRGTWALPYIALVEPLLNYPNGSNLIAIHEECDRQMHKKHLSATDFDFEED